MNAFDTTTLDNARATAAEASGASLGDAQLDHIAGGGIVWLASIFSLGLACAGLSIAEAAAHRDCGDALNH